MIGYTRKGICSVCDRAYNEWTGKYVDEKNICMGCLIADQENKTYDM